MRCRSDSHLEEGLGPQADLEELRVQGLLELQPLLLEGLELLLVLVREDSEQQSPLLGRQRRLERGDLEAVLRLEDLGRRHRQQVALELQPLLLEGLELLLVLVREDSEQETLQLEALGRQRRLERGDLEAVLQLEDLGRRHRQQVALELLLLVLVREDSEQQSLRLEALVVQVASGPLPLQVLRQVDLVEDLVVGAAHLAAQPLAALVRLPLLMQVDLEHQQEEDLVHRPLCNSLSWLANSRWAWVRLDGKATRES